MKLNVLRSSLSWKKEEISSKGGSIVVFQKTKLLISAWNTHNQSMDGYGEGEQVNSNLKRNELNK